MVRKHGYWLTHSDKHIQVFLVELANANWRIIDPPKYYQCLCPCPMKHKIIVHLTPSDAYYLSHLRQFARNRTCYKPGYLKGVN